MSPLDPWTKVIKTTLQTTLSICIPNLKWFRSELTFYFCACGLRNETHLKVEALWKFDLKYNLICPYPNMNKWMNKLSSEILRNCLRIYMFNGLVVLSVNFVRLLKVQISTLDESALDVTKIYIYIYIYIYIFYYFWAMSYRKKVGLSGIRNLDLVLTLHTLYIYIKSILLLLLCQLGIIEAFHQFKIKNRI